MSEATELKTAKEASSEATQETDPFDENVGETALEEIRDEVEKIPPEQVRKLSAHTPFVVGIGLSYAQSFSEDRGLFEETYNKKAFDVEKFDNMDKRAYALWYLDLKKRQAEDPIGPVKELLDAAMPLRKNLLRTAVYLWEEHPVLGRIVEDIRTGSGHVNKGDDLGALATLFRDNWDQVEGRCDVTKDDIVQALKLGAAILKAKSPVQIKELDDLRILRGQVGEYLRRGAETIRAGAVFIHRDDPKALDRYPSIFTKGNKRNGKNGKNGKNGNDSQENEQSQTPAAQAEAENNSLSAA
jgi:hypothetical protein